MDIRNEVRKKIETASLEDSLTRISTLIESSANPKPLQLGILLALRIAKEMRDGRDPGEETALLVQEWASKYSTEMVDESVAFTRQFLLKPNELVDRISKQLEVMDNEEAAENLEQEFDEEKD